MSKRSLMWQIFPAFLLIILLSLSVMAWYAFAFVQDFYLRELTASLEGRARLLAYHLASDESANADGICKDLGPGLQSRITVVRPDGVVIGDSDADPSAMESHADRPELIAALQGRTGTSVRFSDTIRRRMLYVGRPIVRDGAVAGAVRVSVPLTTVDAVRHGILEHVGLALLLMVAVSAASGWALARRISRPLAEMRDGVARFARGQLDFRLWNGGSSEMAALADAMNSMAAQLRERMDQVVRERNERRAILESMDEGVVAIDLSGRILDMNRTAAAWLDTEATAARDRLLLEVARHPDLQQFATRLLAAREPVVADVSLERGEELILRAHGSVLRNASEEPIGAVIVLDDRTRERRVERMRRDFVANVSHELKTPVTAIKGFVETLQEGASDNAATRTRFLDIVGRHADRLGAIINDLLMLSALEHKTETRQVELAEGRVSGVLKQAVEVCQERAAARRIRLVLESAPDLTAIMNAPLLEQAVTNLIDNAVKYSPEGRAVTISAAAAGDEVRIDVRDEGVGIESRHLPRIFERFYRVDNGRSREMGGTGLGLAIVKHVVLAHGGRVAVESQPGKGSLFSLFLPRRAAAPSP